MIVHVVLLEPRHDLSVADQRRALEALARVTSAVPQVRRFRIGRRLMHGLPGYEQQMAANFEYALILEFEGRQDLVEYLRAPAHESLGKMFSTMTAAALAYDYDVVDAQDASGWL